MAQYDVIVIGGGPAGSSAALILGRSRLNVLMIDKATPRNIRAHGVHGFLTRNDIKPLELRKLAHSEVLDVGVQIQTGEAQSVTCDINGFTVRTDGGHRHRSKRVVIATGLADQIPKVEGMDRYYGTSVFHCPFCDGWEVRDKALAVYAQSRKGVPMATGLLTWSRDVILFTDGSPLSKKEREKAETAGIGTRTEKIIRLIGSGKHMSAVELSTGEKVARHALFFDPQPQQQCGIAVELGCRVSRSGAIYTDKKQRTEVDGLYVIGDAAADPNMVVVAAADGVKAALHIVQEMQKEGHWLPKYRDRNR